MTKSKKHIIASCIAAATALFAAGIAKQNVKVSADVTEDYSASISEAKYNVSKTDGAYTLLAATLDAEKMNLIYEVGFKAYKGDAEVEVTSVIEGSGVTYYTSINGATSKTIFNTAEDVPMVVWKIETPREDVSYEAYYKYGYLNENDGGNLWSYAPERIVTSERKTEVKICTVTIDEDGGTAVDDVKVPFGTAASALGAIKLTKTGYHYDSWQFYDGAAWQDIAETVKVESSVTVKPKWIANDDTPYTVNHYKQNVEGNGYLEPEVESKTGTTDAKTAAEAKTYDLYVAQEFEQKNIAGDGTTVVDIYYNKKDLAKANVGYTRSGNNFVVEWDEVQYAEGYEVLVDGEVKEGCTSETKIDIPATACKTVSVKAINNTVGTESLAVTKFLDVSYLTSKKSGYTYISDFNNAGAETMWSAATENASAWFLNQEKYIYQNAYGKLKIEGGKSASGAYIGSSEAGASANGTLNGIKFTKLDANQAAAIYNLPEAFDLAGKGKLFVKTWQGIWNSQLSPYIMLVNGTKKLNVMGNALYCEGGNYNNESAATNTIAPGNYGATFAATNFYANVFAVDLDQLLQTDAWKAVFGEKTSITGIIIGISGALNKYYYLDEIYYGNPPTLNDKYAFSAASGVPSGISWSANGTGTATIVTDEKAADGYALKITHKKTYNFYMQLSEEVNLNEYSSIVVRMKTTSANTYLYAQDTKTNGNSIGVNSLATTSVATGADGEYVEVDILSALKAKIGTLEWFTTWCNDANGGDIYIDSITFTKSQA